MVNLPVRMQYEESGNVIDGDVLGYSGLISAMNVPQSPQSPTHSACLPLEFGS